MDLVRLSKHKKIDDKRKATLKAMEEIHKFQPDVILLYTDKETTEIMLQQVHSVIFIVKTVRQKIPHG